MDENVQRVLERQKMMWSLGDYSRIAEILLPAAKRLVAATGVGPGKRVLDVGAGTGNLAIEAARAGADVVATDLTPHLIEIGSERTRGEGLQIEWTEAPADSLPLDEASFDVVASCFGAFLAPDADGAVREMLRVAKPGGVVGMTTWANDGYTGRSMELSGRYMPPPPEGVSTPRDWGSEADVRARFAAHPVDLDVERASLSMEFDSTDDARKFWLEEAPPGVAAKMLLPPETLDEMVDEMTSLMESFSRGTGGRLEVESEYLLITARKSPATERTGR